MRVREARRVGRERTARVRTGAEARAPRGVGAAERTASVAEPARAGLHSWASGPPIRSSVRGSLVLRRRPSSTEAPVRPRTAASVALLLALAAAFAAVPAALAQTPPNFTNVFTLPDPGVGEGVSWVDLDGDGDLDLTVSNEGQFLKLYRNDGGDVFTDASPAIFSIFGNYTGVAWADF